VDKYAANGAINTVTVAPGDTALGILCSPVTRARVHHFYVMVGGTPVADNVLQWLVRRFNADGTRTAVAPTPLDPAAPASQLGAGQNYTVEPTYTLLVFDLAVHQRGLYQWWAAPQGEIVLPATANNGIGITPIHASYNGSAQAHMEWTE